MRDQQQYEDPQASLARLVAEQVFATDRSTHATRVIASGVYYSTLAGILALIPAIVGALTLSDDAGRAVFFFIVAGIIVIIVGIRSIVVMFEEYRASTVPNQEIQERRIGAWVADAGLSREELQEKRDRETSDREMQEVELARQLALTREKAELDEIARTRAAELEIQRKQAGATRRRELFDKARVKYWLPIIGLGVAIALTVIAYQAVEDALVVTQDEYLAEFREDPSGGFQDILDACADVEGRAEAPFSFQGRNGILFRVDAERSEVSRSDYLTCFSEKLTGTGLDGLADDESRTQGGFVVEKNLESYGDDVLVALVFRLPDVD